MGDDIEMFEDEEDFEEFGEKEKKDDHDVGEDREEPLDFNRVKHGPGDSRDWEQ